MATPTSFSPPGTVENAELPNWDANEGVLRYAGEIVKCFACRRRIKWRCSTRSKRADGRPASRIHCQTAATFRPNDGFKTPLRVSTVAN
jgi:hypothetical protein